MIDIIDVVYQDNSLSTNNEGQFSLQFLQRVIFCERVISHKITTHVAD